MQNKNDSPLVLAIDQGTTGTTVLVLDSKLNLLARADQEFPQHYPQNGWVEHHPEEIWQSFLSALRQVLKTRAFNPRQIAAIGITNQRETTLVWDKQTGKPIYPAIVWQDRRTALFCERLRKKGFEKIFRKKTGLLLDPYFSGTKIRWILDHVPHARESSKRGELAFGTIDTYLIWRLTQGKVHVTDPSNASRTLLMDLQTLEWDPELLQILRISPSLLPAIASSSEIYGTTQGIPGLPDGIPISGIAGDQQAALFGQACFQAGEAKCTYGTGSFILMNTGHKIVESTHQLLTTVAWKLGKKVSYALEGSAFIAGAAVQWLRDGLQIISSAPEVEQLARSVPDSGGVVFVPALVGLGAPYWNSQARGLISGITRATTSAHLARATLEGIAFLQHDILKAMTKDLGRKLKILKVDGGASLNSLLMQFQADLLRVRLMRPEMVETTALGAAFLAGLAVGIWKSVDEISKQWRVNQVFDPTLPLQEVKKKIKEWQKAMRKANL